MSGCTRYAIESSDVDEKKLSEKISQLPSVIFTENAANKVAQIILEEENPALNLRLAIKTGGCSGLEYEFSLDEKIRQNDRTVNTNGVTLTIDAKSFRFLSGATIDYIEDLEGERFTIENPNAEKTCGCGSSFDIKEADET